MNEPNKSKLQLNLKEEPPKITISSPHELTQINVLVHHSFTKKQSPPPDTQINNWATNVPGRLSPLSNSFELKKSEGAGPNQNTDISSKTDSDGGLEEEIFNLELSSPLYPQELSATHKDRPSI